MTLEATPSRSHDASSLRGLCSGAVQLPGDQGYDLARMPWNVAVDQRPAAVVYPESAEEVAQVVRAAAAAGLRVAPQGTGHNAAPLGPLDDVVLMRMNTMTGVSVDPDAMTARAAAGALWIDATEAAAAHGCAVLHGSSPDVGVVGYSLGGGLGWYARSLGMQTNALTAVELVTADGSLVRADAEHEPDLFWALRGGGGNFGVVTAVEFSVFGFDSAYAGMLVWDLGQAEPVLSRWASWAAEAPESVTTSLRLLRVPQIPDIPEPFRGAHLVVIDGAVLADDETAAGILAPLRELGPTMDTFGRAPVASLARLHMDPEGPTPAVSDSALLTELPAAAIDALLGVAGPECDVTLLAIELRQLGGAVGRPAPGGGALSHLPDQMGLYAVAIAPTPEMGARGQAEATRLVQQMAPWSGGRHYLNFTEHAVDTSTAYTAESWSRLCRTHAQLDPHSLFVANHVVA